jgi:5-formyltetrahydrofolate cyclo-ligase
MDERQGTSEKNQQAKSVMRADMRAKLRLMPMGERSAASVQACKLLEQQAVWQKADSILFYAPVAEELDVWQLLGDSLAAGKTVLLPRFDTEKRTYVACHIKHAERDVRIGQFGIREPGADCGKISLNRLDFILVPGLAFDLDGHRLGRGRGFYDQLLTVVQGPTCGVAFDQQIISRVPVEPHDVRLNCILTPTRWRCQESQRAVLK